MNVQPCICQPFCSTLPSGKRGEETRGEERGGDSETEAEEDKRGALGASHTDDPLSWGPWLD